MCANSHSIAAVGSAFPVASSAFLQRIDGKPMPSSWTIASALKAGSSEDSSWFTLILSSKPPTRQESALTCFVPRELYFCNLQPFSNVPVHVEDIRGREVYRDVEFRRDPVYKLELLRVDYEDFRECREPGSPVEPR